MTNVGRTQPNGELPDVWSGTLLTMEKWGMWRILVVEDEERVRSMFRMLLERAGYEVEVARDGREGIALCRDNPADVVIANIVMPEKNGIDTIMQIRHEFPEVKVIAISADARIDPDRFLGGAEACRTLLKPVDWHELLAAIPELVGEAEHTAIAASAGTGPAEH